MFCFLGFFFFGGGEGVVLEVPGGELVMCQCPTGAG